jgi:hypothetical protein
VLGGVGALLGIASGEVAMEESGGVVAGVVVRE